MSLKKLFTDIRKKKLDEALRVDPDIGAWDEPDETPQSSPSPSVQHRVGNSPEDASEEWMSTASRELAQAEDYEEDDIDIHESGGFFGRGIEVDLGSEEWYVFESMEDANAATVRRRLAEFDGPGGTHVGRASHLSGVGDRLLVWMKTVDECASNKLGVKQPGTTVPGAGTLRLPDAPAWHEFVRNA